MTDIRRVGDSGVHTVEGNVAGARAARLTREREKQQQSYEEEKRKKKMGMNVFRSIDEHFVSGPAGPSQREERKEKGPTDEEKKEVERLRAEVKTLEKKKRKRKMAASLSFDVDEVCEDLGEKVEEESKPTKKKISKNPDVDTSHLPDRERDRALEEKRQRLKEEWLAEQEVIKKQMVEVVYSWWDGSGHRKAMEVRKGTTIGKFLEYVKLQLSPEFPEVRSISSDGLLYVKEDMIIPHHISFYDLIAMKARGKSGPLFHFDVHDDVRLVNDSRIEKDESHPGKVVDRHWYEKNKHIFPASRWEMFDPTKQRSVEQKYTLHGN